jgi:hypothetical protein
LKTTFGYLITKGFGTTVLGATTILSFGITFIVWIFAPTVKLPIWTLIFLGCVFIIALIGLLRTALLAYEAYAALYEAYEKQKEQTSLYDLPKVVNVYDFQGSVLCVLGPSNLFSYNIGVSFFLLRDDVFEQLIALGTVINIQTDGKIQVVIEDTLDGHEETVQMLRQRNQDVMRQLVVKPHVPQSYLARLGGER